MLLIYPLNPVRITVDQRLINVSVSFSKVLRKLAKKHGLMKEKREKTVMYSEGPADV